MAAETKTKGVKAETVLSKSLKAKFKSKCRKLGISQAQRIRDMIQKDVK